LLASFGKVLVPEMNNGQLATILRSSFLLPAVSLPKISGKPFKVREVTEGIRSTLEN
jgi:2-oxoglutarate ferredoxin oxidoreductase subunit alpha